MRTWFIRLGMLAPIILISGGCLSLGAGQSSPAQPRQHADRYTLFESSHLSARGCEYDYRVFEPAQAISPSTVMLGHGFLRDQDRLVELSRALANSGIRTVTLDFCNMRPWNGNHRANAIDMHDLAQILGRSDDVLFGGFSAGALAAILAADSRTRAIVLLDFVDQNNLGANALETLPIPVIGLHGPPSSCNADGLGTAAVAQHLRNLDRTGTEYSLVENASHCEFESPTNWLCQSVCGDNDSASHNRETRQFIIDETIRKIRPHLHPIES